MPDWHYWLLIALLVLNTISLMDIGKSLRKIEAQAHILFDRTIRGGR